MGSGISTSEKSIRLVAEEDNCQINVDFLFSALYKLACIFEIKESLTISLSNEIRDPKHCNFDSQFRGVEEWVMKHGECELTPQETFHLIKYVELYKPAPVAETFTDEKKNYSFVALPLMCPYQKDVDEWTAAIRREEQKKTIFKEQKKTLFKENSALRHENSEHTLCMTSRVRFYSDMSEE